MNWQHLNRAQRDWALFATFLAITALIVGTLVVMALTQPRHPVIATYAPIPINPGVGTSPNHGGYVPHWNPYSDGICESCFIPHPHLHLLRRLGRRL
jgi:hypothetical protein